MISAYNINHQGVLVYSGLPIKATDLTLEHHQGRTHSNFPKRYQYEVYAIGQYGLIHGHPGRIFNTLNPNNHEQQD